MLKVKTPEEVTEIIKQHFSHINAESETVKTPDALGRVLSTDIISDENVPGFNRSTVDGFAVLASDTFGCSDSIPAVLTVVGEVLMGESADHQLTPGTCVIVSTGGDIPSGTNAVIMLEHTEDYGSGMVGIHKPAAPGNNVIFKGDDVSTGDVVLQEGIVLTPHDIGILSSLGLREVNVKIEPTIGIISTGDELVSPYKVPERGQVRDVNTQMLQAAVKRFGAHGKVYGIIKDDEEELREVVLSAARTCDIVLISGGSSAGARDLTAHIIETEGELLLHGIAMKPGKPTILGIIKSKPIFGLPGHPVAAYLVTELFVRPLITMQMGAKIKQYTTKAKLAEAISSNHGREEYIAVRLVDGIAYPVRGKSGLITSLTGVDGYICVPRDCEGLAKDTDVIVKFF